MADSSINIYNYQRVAITPNLNNTMQIFVFEENGKFIDVAEVIGDEGVSAEVAKSARNVFKKALKEKKAKIAEAREFVEINTPRILEEIALRAPKTKAPKIQGINDIEMMSAMLRDQAKITGIDVLSEWEALGSTPKEKNKKEDLSFENAILNERLKTL